MKKSSKNKGKPKQNRNFLNILLFGILIVLLVIFYRQKTNPLTNIFNTETLPTLKPEPKLKDITIGDKVIKVNLADNDDTRRLGLGGVTFLQENTGMLFVFEKKNVRPIFWMKDMVIPIDIIWISGDKIVEIHKNVQPQPDIPDNELKLYIPNYNVDYVLEVNAGDSDKFNWKAGTKVIL